ncbi:MAG: hypothetical protein IT215_03645 [Chitinophagaceae bacterium]|nr:hypothetical protein [Chitinophagaceae bacterium]HMN32905.1 hypothetical protein [Chitinophagaceae bacterium]
MNKKISTNVGAITGIIILAYMLLIRAWVNEEHSYLVLGSYLLLLFGMIISTLILYKYYSDIKVIDAFIHNARTGITALVIILIGSTLMYLFLSPQKTFTDYNIQLMKIVFSFTISGLISSLFTSVIFNIFAKYF